MGATDGVLNAMLGNVTPIPPSVASNASLYLGVTVGSNGRNDPRASKLGSVAYALQAITVPDGSITGGKLADGAVTSTKIADGAINQAKAPSLVRSPNGDSNMIQSGTLTAGLTSSQLVNFDVTFPVAFSTTPVIVVSNCTNSSQQQWSGDSIAVYGKSRSNTGFRARLRLGGASGGGTYRLCWIAMGQ